MDVRNYFLNDLQQSLLNAYMNGRKPGLTRREPKVKFYEQDYEKLIESIKNT